MNKNFEEYFQQYHFLEVIKARKFLKNILDTHIYSKEPCHLTCKFYLPIFLLKYPEQEFSRI